MGYISCPLQHDQQFTRHRPNSGFFDIAEDLRLEVHRVFSGTHDLAIPPPNGTVQRTPLSALQWAVMIGAELSYNPHG